MSAGAVAESIAQARSSACASWTVATISKVASVANVEEGLQVALALLANPYASDEVVSEAVAIFKPTHEQVQRAADAAASEKALLSSLDALTADIMRAVESSEDGSCTSTTSIFSLLPLFPPQ